MMDRNARAARHRRPIGSPVGATRPARASRRIRRGAVAGAVVVLVLLAGLSADRGLLARQAVPPSVTVIVGADRPLRPISPLIYGVAAAGPTQVEALAATGARLNRRGGNRSSRYNWELGNAWNAGRDWSFANVSIEGAVPSDNQPSGYADRFIATNLAAGVHTVMTIPAIGWVAKDNRNSSRSIGVPDDGGSPLSPGSDAIAGYDPAANRNATSLPSFARKGAPFADRPDLSDGRVYQDEWINHLVRRFGLAADGGVRFYAVDNEPDLWFATHTDVRPVRPGYDDLLAIFLEYAVTIKDVDPSALILGPSSWGWTGYMYSPLDQGTDGYRTAADRRAHGGMPFLPWWLDQVRQHDEQTGRRTLDVLSVHFYPQARGVHGGASDGATNALRLRSTRALWDPTYVDESWIREPVYLIPRLREWIERHYPGTLLAVGEWNWGAETTVNGALAIADVLGIFGREGLDLAAYWTYPPPGSPGALAFSLYTNYDGRGGAFGDLALPASSDAPDDVAAYASLDSARGDLIVVAINKRPEAALPATFRLEGLVPAGPARVYRLAQDDPTAIRDLGEQLVTGQDVSLTLPPYSATLLRVAR